MIAQSLNQGMQKNLTQVQWLNFCIFIIINDTIKRGNLLEEISKTVLIIQFYGNFPDTKRCKDTHTLNFETLNFKRAFE